MSCSCINTIDRCVEKYCTICFEDIDSNQGFRCRNCLEDICFDCNVNESDAKRLGCNVSLCWSCIETIGRCDLSEERDIDTCDLCEDFVKTHCLDCVNCKECIKTSGLSFFHCNQCNELTHCAKSKCVPNECKTCRRDPFRWKDCKCDEKTCDTCDRDVEQKCKKCGSCDQCDDIYLTLCEGCKQQYCVPCFKENEHNYCCEWNRCYDCMNIARETSIGNCYSCRRDICVKCDEDMLVISHEYYLICSDCQSQKEVKRLMKYIQTEHLSHYMTGPLYDKNIVEIIIKWGPRILCGTLRLHIKHASPISLRPQPVGL